MPTTTNNQARSAIQQLLTGAPPNGITPDDCGEWAEVYKALSEAYTNSGPQGVQTAWNVLCPVTPGLAELIAADPADRKLELFTADYILTTNWPEPVWAIPDLLPVGFTILAGKPKTGKSWLALQTALAVATGGWTLGKQVERGPVLYLALEDPPRRLRERMNKQQWTLGLQADFMTLGNYADQIGDLRGDGAAILAAQIEQRAYRLVVIDTLSRAIHGKQDKVEDMTAALTPIQETAHTLNCAVLIIDHHRKGFGGEPDAISDILGSTGKGAMVDTAWGLYRESGKAGAKLQIIGREIPECTLALTFDSAVAIWQSEGDADELELTERRQEILDALAALGLIGVSELADAIGQDKGNTYHRLQDLVNAGLVQKEGKRYVLPS